LRCAVGHVPFDFDRIGTSPTHCHSAAVRTSTMRAPGASFDKFVCFAGRDRAGVWQLQLLGAFARKPEYLSKRGHGGLQSFQSERSI
jgi:hypothetical protein